MQKSMNIENPFIFGRAAEGTYFTDREEDAKRLVKGAVLIYPMLDYRTGGPEDLHPDEMTGEFVWSKEGSLAKPCVEKLV